MVLFKACPRCRGDLRRQEQVDGTQIVCVQCGYDYEVPASRPASVPIPALSEETRKIQEQARENANKTWARKKQERVAA